MQAFICEYKLKELVLQNGCPSNYLALLCKTTLIKKVSIQIPEAFKQHSLNIFTPPQKNFCIQRASFLASPFLSLLFFHATLLMGAHMISPKVIVECPDSFAKKHFKKENPLRKGGSTQYRGCGIFQNRGLVPTLPTMCDI